MLPCGRPELLAVPREVTIGEVGLTGHVNLLPVQVECLIQVSPLHLIHTLLTHGLRRHECLLSFGWLDDRSHVLLSLRVVPLPLVQTEGVQTDLLKGVALVRLMDH